MFCREVLKIQDQKYGISDVKCAHLAVESYMHKKPIWIQLIPDSHGRFTLEFHENEILEDPIEGEARIHTVWDDGESLIDLVAYYGWCRYITQPSGDGD